MNRARVHVCYQLLFKLLSHVTQFKCDSYDWEIVGFGMGRALNFIPMHCIAMHWSALHITALHITALYITALNITALNCTSLQCIVLHITALHLAELGCSFWYCSVWNFTQSNKHLKFDKCPQPSRPYRMWHHMTFYLWEIHKYILCIYSIKIF